MAAFSHGSAELGALAADVVEERVDSNWVRVVTRIANADSSPTWVDLAYYGGVTIGGALPTVVLRTADQPFIDFVGPNWTLTALIRSVPGLSVDPVKYWPGAGAYQQVSTPYVGTPGNAMFWWDRLYVPANGAIDVAMAFGVRPAPFDIPPLATPRPVTSMTAQLGNTSYAWNMAYLGQPTTYGGAGWDARIRRSAAWTNASSFSAGVVDLSGLHGQFRTEQISDGWVKITATIRNDLELQQMFDLAWYGDLMIGGEDTPRASVARKDQPLITFIGRAWNLNVVTQPYGGADATGVDTWAANNLMWTQTATPFNATMGAVTFTWVNRTLERGESRDFSLLFGVGDPPFGYPPEPTPQGGPPSATPPSDATVPTGGPGLEITPGGPSGGFQMRFNGAPTTEGDAGWQVALRLSGWSPVFFFSGGRVVNVTADILSGEVRVEKLNANFSRVMFSMTTRNGYASIVQIGFGAQLRLSGALPEFALETLDDATWTFVGPHYNLTVVTRPISSNANVTTMTRFGTNGGFGPSFSPVALPYAGKPSNVTFDHAAENCGTGP
jgi:hypothetical protein